MKQLAKMVFVTAFVGAVFCFGGTTGTAETDFKDTAVETIELQKSNQTMDTLLSEFRNKKSIMLGDYEETYIVLDAIPFETETIETEDLADGVLEVVQQGAFGEKETVVEVAFVNGEEKSRALIEERINQPPVNKIQRKGTGKVVRVGEAAYRYSREIIMNATAYTAGYESTGKNPGDTGYGVTASGVPVRHGIVSVDPSVIPLGAKLYVEGYGVSLAADTGSAIKGNKIDLYYERLDDALRFGRRNIKVYVLQ